MIHNGLRGGTYVEPYAGGAGAAIYLLMEGAVDRIIINDVDPAIYAFWSSVLHDTDRFLKKLDRCVVSLAARERHRRILLSPTGHSRLDLGFATFFLNRTNRSGILRGGVIGGQSQTGRYKMDARFNRKDLAARIERIALMRDKIDIFGDDAMSLLRRIKRRLPAHSLIYFDPPYYVKGAQLYRNFYTARDHTEIARSVLTLRTPWLVTYDNCPEIRTLYSNASTEEFSLCYSTHLSRKRATEVMFFNNINLPRAPYLRR